VGPSPSSASRLIADKFHEFVRQLQREMTGQVEGFGVRARIVNRNSVLDHPQIQAPESLYCMQLVGMRMPGEIKPRAVVESYSVHHQRVAFTMADRISVPIWVQLLGMLPPIEIDLPAAVNISFKQNYEQIRHLQELHRVRRQSRYAGRQTQRLGIIRRFAGFS
jgi:hypothetical protein